MRITFSLMQYLHDDILVKVALDVSSPCRVVVVSNVYTNSDPFFILYSTLTVFLSLLLSLFSSFFFAWSKAINLAIHVRGLSVKKSDVYDVDAHQHAFHMILFKFTRLSFKESPLSRSMIWATSSSHNHSRYLLKAFSVNTYSIWSRQRSPVSLTLKQNADWCALAYKHGNYGNLLAAQPNNWVNSNMDLVQWSNWLLATRVT